MWNGLVMGLAHRVVMESHEADAEALAPVMFSEETLHSAFLQTWEGFGLIDTVC